MNTPPLEPWQWPEEKWREVTNHVRAGKRLAPKIWPNQARCAVALSFDSDHETNDLRDGGESTSKLSQGQYGNLQGVPRILNILSKYGVPASFYVPAVTALLHPQEQERIISLGHEIALHGWIHERNSVLPYEAERDLMLRASDVLTKVTGKRPVGIRTASWDFSPNTLTFIKEMNLQYDSSLMADVDCYELLLDGVATGIVELPVEWIRDDAVYFNMNRFSSLRPQISPQDVFEIFWREFEGAYEEGGLFQLTMHPHIIGHRSRAWIIDSLIKKIQEKGNVWFATHADIVQYVKSNSN
ncbi:MAG: polysaccharide deacetylase [Betaproteobacteria bacterium]